MQLGADRLPGGGLDLAHVEQVVLEHAAAEQAEPRQRGAGGGAEVAAGELQRGEQRGVPALVGVLRSSLLTSSPKSAADRLRRQRPQVRADQLQRERMVGQVVAAAGRACRGRAAGSFSVSAVALEDAVQQPEAVGPGQAVQLELPRAGQAGLAGPAGDEHAALARTGGQVAEEVGEPAALRRRCTGCRDRRPRR